MANLQRIKQQIKEKGFASLTQGQKDFYQANKSKPQVAPQATQQPSVPSTQPTATSSTVAPPAVSSGTSEADPTNSLVEFASILDQVSGLARKKRQDMVLKILGKEFEPGALSASDFGSVLGSVQRAGQQFGDKAVELTRQEPLKEQAGFTLSPGQTRFDAGGNIIAGVPKTEVGSGITGLTGGVLSPRDLTSANALAKQIYGGSTIKTKDGYSNFVVPIIERMKGGESIDEIADDLRFQGQSTAFTGTIRDAAQQITSKLTGPKTEVVFDKLDDILGSGDTEKIRDFLKKIAIENSAGGTAQAKTIMGNERTVEFLDEIFQDLKDYEDAGGDTNIFTGGIEGLAKRAGTVKDPELRKIATKITAARMKYRRAMTGLAFSEGENIEYDAIFPNINKTQDFNTATIDGLREAMRGDVDFFYSFAMGQDAYNELFKGQTAGVSGTSNENFLNLLPGGDTSSLSNEDFFNLLTQ